VEIMDTPRIFILSLFNDAISISGYIVLNGRSNELGRREMVTAYFQLVSPLLHGKDYRKPHI
jgi:hypothetical protein